MKQTAVEWLVHELDKQMIERDKFDAFDWIFEDLIKKAKLIEIDQMRAIHLMTWMNKDFDFEQYIKDNLNK